VTGFQNSVKKRGPQCHTSESGGLAPRGIPGRRPHRPPRPPPPPPPPPLNHRRPESRRPGGTHGTTGRVLCCVVRGGCGTMTGAEGTSGGGFRQQAENQAYKHYKSIKSS